MDMKKEPIKSANIAIRFSAFAERWFPDAFVFVALAVVLVALAAIGNGAPATAVFKTFGDGFWSLITFTLQMSVMVLAGHVIALSRPMQVLIEWLASKPRTGAGAIAMIASATMIVSFASWAMSLIVGGLLARACARRNDLVMDYRAAGAAGNLGMGATWALGLSSSAAQLQANPASLPKNIFDITGIIPLTDTIFLWQSMAMAAIIFAVTVTTAYLSAPSAEHSRTAKMLGVDVHDKPVASSKPATPGEWLEWSPLLTLALSVLAVGWLVQELAHGDLLRVISSLNTYNFIFLMVGLLLHWRPRLFLNAVSNAVPATGAIMVQFPFYGAVAAILTLARNADGLSVADQIAHAFVTLSTQNTYPLVMGAYSAILGLLIPSGGGKWILEAPYVMQAAISLKVNLGWTVQIYNAAEALPNLINPFFMLPLLSILGLKARDIVGFTFVQFLVNTPLVLFLLWAFAKTLPYVPPVLP
jgi:short-chain fatty acids transporter